MKHDDEEYLQIFYSLLDLHQLAAEQDKKKIDRIQNELREKYKQENAPFRWSMPLRHYGPCAKCSQRFTEVWFELENPKLQTSARTLLSHLHAVQEHDAPMDVELKLFLADIK